MRQKVKVSMNACNKIFVSSYILFMHADLENGNIAENSNGEYIVWIMNIYSYCNYAMLLSLT